ncbi:hypothetical protein [Burkholderia stabilis]|uniref:hypothetical protein n=1 Tax=Burkholderia stabilis TaxID=95485 RepID=UPI001592AC68|nr:hypothetical protein [Burkholderia stabilis]
MEILESKSIAADDIEMSRKAETNDSISKQQSDDRTPSFGSGCSAGIEHHDARSGPSTGEARSASPGGVRGKHIHQHRTENIVVT